MKTMDAMKIDFRDNPINQSVGTPKMEKGKIRILCALRARILQSIWERNAPFKRRHKTGPESEDTYGRTPGVRKGETRKDDMRGGRMEKRV